MSDPNYNDYGHTPCPRCGQPFRYMHADHGNNVVCDACPYLEPASRANSSEYSAARLDDEPEAC